MIKFISQDGTLVVTGIRDENDVVFTSEHRGTFNVTAAFEWATQYLEPFEAICDTAQTLQHLSKHDLDMARIQELEKLTNDELCARTVLLYLDLYEINDGSLLLIDGNHRLAVMASRAGRCGQAQVSAVAYTIPKKISPEFRVRYFRELTDGRRDEIASSDVLDLMHGVHVAPDGNLR